MNRFTLYIVVIALFYAWFENVFDWNRVALFFGWLPRIGVVWGYTYIFMPIFITTMIALYPVRKTVWHYIYGMALFALAEDILYFVWRLQPIEMGMWTTKVIGALDFGAIAIPLWYFIAIGIIIITRMKLGLLVVQNE